MSLSQPVPLDRYLTQPTLAERELRRMWPTSAPLTIFDIGSCEGEDSIRYARLFPRSRIYAFEPLPENQALIRANFERYSVPNTELVPVALSDCAGPAQLHVSGGEPPVKFAGEDWNYGNKSSSLLAPADVAPMHGWIQFNATVTVECDTLDAFCAARKLGAVDFIHLDVQGAEGRILSGAHKMLPCIGALWLEVADAELYAGQKLRPEIEAVLRKAGFALVGQERRAVESDQFYVNLRGWRGRRAAWETRAKTFYRSWRQRIDQLRPFSRSHS